MEHMLYILGLVTALQIVIAQSLWKVGLSKTSFEPTVDYVFSGQIIKVFLSPMVLGGVLLYVSATVSFFALLSKFEYSHAQTTVVISSLIFTFLSAIVIFGEKFSFVNVLGILFLLIGVVLITRY